MGYESNEERLERLERQVAKLTETLNNSLETQRKLNALLLDSNSKLSAAHIASLRFLATQPIFGDEKVRLAFTDMVAKAESDYEQPQAMIADLVKSLLSPTPPPSDQPPGS